MLSRNFLLLASTVIGLSLLSPLSALADKGGHPHHDAKDAEKAAREAQKDADKAAKEAAKAREQQIKHDEHRPPVVPAAVNPVVPPGRYPVVPGGIVPQPGDRPHDLKNWNLQLSRAKDPVQRAKIMKKINTQRMHEAGIR